MAVVTAAGQVVAVVGTEVDPAAEPCTGRQLLSHPAGTEGEEALIPVAMPRHR